MELSIPQVETSPPVHVIVRKNGDTSSRLVRLMTATTAPDGKLPGAAPDGMAGPDPRRWLILGVIALAQLMVVLDATIVTIALPSAQQSLHFSNVDRQWVVTAYALAFGSLLLLGGKLSDLLGRRVTF